MSIINLDDYRKKDTSEIVFEDDDALVEFIYTWMQEILTEAEIMKIAQRLEKLYEEEEYGN